MILSFQRDALLNTEQDEAAVVQAPLLKQDLDVVVVRDWGGCGHGGVSSSGGQASDSVKNEGLELSGGQHTCSSGRGGSLRWCRSTPPVDITHQNQGGGSSL